MKVKCREIEGHPKTIPSMNIYIYLLEGCNRSLGGKLVEEALNMTELELVDELELEELVEELEWVEDAPVP